MEITDWVNAVGVVATLIIAIAALVISRKQTFLAAEQASSTAMQVKIDQNQLDISRALSKLEILNQTPRIVPANLTWNKEEGSLSLILVNTGGGVAVDVWIGHLLILVSRPESPEDRVLNAIQVGQRIDVIRDQVSVRVHLPPGYSPGEVEKIVAFSGTGVFPGDSEDREISYETVAGMLEKLQRMSS